MFPLPLLVSSPRFLQQIKPNYSCRMCGLPPRPVSILFLVVMTVLLERHVWSTEKLMFPVVQIKEKSGQLPEQRQERASVGGVGGNEQENEDTVRKPWAHKEGGTKDSCASFIKFVNTHSLLYYNISNILVFIMSSLWQDTNCNCFLEFGREHIAWIYEIYSGRRKGMCIL